MEIKLNEVEVTKLNLQPGEVLVIKVKLYNTEFMSADSLKSLGNEFRKVFPNNRVALLAMNPDEDIELTTIKDDSIVKNDCSDPVQYCNDCSCGKKERIEGGNLP